MIPFIYMDGEPDVATVGGKSAALMRLANQGFDVPPFVTLPAGETFAGDKFPLTDGPFAVRSSAVEEDGGAHSHAGQFLSLLNVVAKDVSTACAKVMASGHAGSVGDYRKSQGLEGTGGGTAVLIQQMVDARVAGVMFSADPVFGRRDRVVISAIEGLGDRLVGGEEDGETTVLDREGSVIEGEPGVLTEDDLAKLHALALDVEAKSGGPQDIEWAFEGERLFLLQSRPITTALRAAPLTGDDVTVLDNSNIVESYPGLVSPLTYSFAQYAYARVYRAFVRLVGVSEDVIAREAQVFDNMLSRVDGRVYYNLVNWYRALALLPGFAINRGHMETMMGVGEPLPPKIADEIAPPAPSGTAKVAEWGRMGRSGVLLAWNAFRIRSLVADFERRLATALSTPVTELQRMTLPELARYYRRIEADLLDRWDAPLVNDFLCMMAFGASRKLLESWGGPEGLEVHNDLMIGQGDIVSAEPPRRIREMGAMLEGRNELRARLLAGEREALADHKPLATAFDEYLAKFADRCTEELKLESVTLDRDPTPLLMAIAASRDVLERAEEDGIDRLADLLKGHPVQLFIARRVVNWAKRRVRDRENLRFERTRIFGRARAMFRAAGSQFHAMNMLDDPEDVFMLTVPEVLGAIEGYGAGDDLAALAKLRRDAMDAAAKRPDPDERLTVNGAVHAGLDRLVGAAPSEIESGDTRSATGCSAGVVTAKARVVRDPRTESLEKGEVLVARHTDPGWIAIFTNASAIVVERGSLLSHSAIVAREMGIPCVVGLKGAMDWIEDGETIEVDGATGQVRKIS